MLQLIRTAAPIQIVPRCTRTARRGESSRVGRVRPRYPAAIATIYPQYGEALSRTLRDLAWFAGLLLVSVTPAVRAFRRGTQGLALANGSLP